MIERLTFIPDNTGQENRIIDWFQDTHSESINMRFYPSSLKCYVCYQRPSEWSSAHKDGMSALDIHRPRDRSAQMIGDR